jgi:hypothetical protein
MMTSVVCKFVRGLGYHKGPTLLTFFFCDTLRGQRQAFKLPVVSLRQKEFTVVPFGKAFTTGTPFSSHMTVIMTLPADGTQLRFLKQDVLCHFNC